MLVVDEVVTKDNERDEMVQQDNEMESKAEKDHLEEGVVEEIEGGGDGGKPPYKPEYQYSREELMRYSDHPLSRQRPIITDPQIDSLCCWLKSSGWNSYKRSDTPTDRGDDSYKRRTNDPRERVRKEQDGIVLSPQRRSFNSGCFVTVAPNNVVRPPAESAKEGPVRRIGSGRIINRDWEFRDKENADDGYPYRSAVGPSPRERDDRFDLRRNYPGMSAERELVRDVSRESLSREKDLRADPRVRDRERLMPRYSVDRRRFEAEEPEWFSGPPSPPMYGYCEIPVPPVVRRGPNFHVLRTVAWSPLQLPLPRPFRPPRLCVPYVKTFGGPTSQHDTIELRGFEDANEGGARNKTKQISKISSKPNSRDSRSNTGSRKSSSEEISVNKTGSGGIDKEVEQEPTVSSSSPKVEPHESQKTELDNVNAEETGRTDGHDFLNLEDFLQLDNLPLLTNGGGGEGNQSSSRFSQWFRRDSPSDVNDTRRSSLQDELIKNIINDINEPSINIPHVKESDAYFAPISPAGTTLGNSLLEMLQNSHQQSEHHAKAPSIKDLEATGKVTSVEELEARMRQGAGQSPVNQSSQSHSKKGTSSSRKEEELIAFKKLLKQVAEGGVTAANDQFNRSSASSLYQMLNKPPEPSDMMGQAHQPAAAPQMHVPHDLVYKLLHVQEQQRQVQQQQELNKLLFTSGRLAPPHVPGALSPLPPDLQVKVANSQPSAELLARPEAQAILQGLRQGEITPQHLVQQLQNPAMQPRHREVLACILKLHGNSPRPASPLVVPPDPTLIQQLMLQQQLRNPSPLPSVHNAFCQSSMISPNPLGTSSITLTVQHAGLPHRVPSPRELMLHTQTIMQSALIKKKLEEQRENFRKRQEMQRATSPNIAAGVKSPNSHLTTATTVTNANNNSSSSASVNNVINSNNNNNNNDTNTTTATSAAAAATTTTTPTTAPTTITDAVTPTTTNNNNNNTTTANNNNNHNLSNNHSNNSNSNNNNNNNKTSPSSSSSVSSNNNTSNSYSSPGNNNNSMVVNNNSLNSTPTTAGTTAVTAAARSNATAAKSPTPLAFTPTSVLRKMTAEQQPTQVKDGDGNKINKYDLFQAKLQRQNELFKIQAAQSSRFLANNQLLGLRSPQQQWPVQKQAMHQQQQPLQQGRAIVKGSGNYAPAPPLGAGLVDLPYGSNARGVYPQRSKLTMPAAPLVQPNLYNSFSTPANRVPPPPSRGLAPQMGPLAQHNVNVNPALQHLLMSQNMTSAQQRNLYKPGIRNPFPQYLPPNGGDGDLSTSPTTSNQLAHWFTPELLAQAQAQAQTRSGKSDSTLNMVSVEELERLQQNSAPVIN